MDPEQQMLVQALQGGLPGPLAPAGQLANPSSVKGLSPEALAALFLVPGINREFDYGTNSLRREPTVSGQSGNYDIVHDKAGKVGEAMLSWKPHDRNVHVIYASAPQGFKEGVGESSAAKKGNSWAHTLGTVEIRSLLKSLAGVFPKAETVDGLRISGAREVAGQEMLNKAIQGGRPVRPGGYMGDTAKIRIRQPMGGMPGTKLTDLW